MRLELANILWYSNGTKGRFLHNLEGQIK
uniref:Uncharacterized protein n=1 Tax=Rhizophora mucronata TaxID=61149 RepID=A0A2P2LIV0_RHIMU